MTAIAATDLTNQVATQTVPAVGVGEASALAEASALRNRFILTEVERFTLVFPAVWVAEILRLDRSQILDLPFYGPLMVGIVNHNGQITPLVAAARLLKVESFTLRERLLVVRLNQTAGSLANIGFIVDRAIASSTRDKLPADLFTTAATTTSEMVLLHPELIPAGIWQPQRWG
jgi:chemotaxis signal transduction protein